MTKKGYLGALITATSVIMAVSCSEDIETSNLYTFIGMTASDYLEENVDRFGSFLYLAQQVTTSKQSPSSVADLLDARGHYTCFVPDNQAIDDYLDSLCRRGELDSPDIHSLPISVARDIVYNSIIDGGLKYQYLSTDFVEGSLSQTNMNNRFINITYGIDSMTNITQIYVNTKSKIVEKDIEVENGVIHIVDKVISPSNSLIGDMVCSTDNLSIFGHLMALTGWPDKMRRVKDESFDDFNLAGEDVIISRFQGVYVSQRFYGYTVFAEPDEVFRRYGITDEVSLMKWLKENAYYDEATTSYGTDYTNEDNAINQFVAYHLLPEALTWNKMVIFSNEYGFNNNIQNDGSKVTVNVWEYYETLGKHRHLLKVTAIRGGQRYINRQSFYKKNSYLEDVSRITIPGIEVTPTNESYSNYALNGYYYPINDILIWNYDVPNKVLNERIRMDVCSLLPEIMSNNYRQNQKQANWFFPPYYFENIVNPSNETVIFYSPNPYHEGSRGSWVVYQAECFHIMGSYDLTLKLPPVPYTGTYEVRFAVAANEYRGMAQIYLSTNPNNLPAIGIPIDLRVYGSQVGWVEDTGDETIDTENDKQLRNMDYMKGPKYFYPTAGYSGRDCPTCMRKIIYRGQMDSEKTYYVRIKSLLESTNTEFVYDYIEIVPKKVYHSDEREDIW